MPAIETFVLPSQYDFEAAPVALGKSRIAHGSGLDSFGSFDTTLPRWQLTLVFKGIREQYGTNMSIFGNQPDHQYLLQFFERNVCGGPNICSIVGLARGDSDTVARLYTFADFGLQLRKFSFQLWSGQIKFLQHGVGDYTVANLPNPLMI